MFEHFMAKIYAVVKMLFPILAYYFLILRD